MGTSKTLLLLGARSMFVLAAISMFKLNLARPAPRVPTPTAQAKPVWDALMAISITQPPKIVCSVPPDLTCN